MKKVLYIDYLTKNGHVLFNRIQLQALLSQTEVDIDLVVRDSFEPYQDLRITPLFVLSSKYYFSGRWGSRLCTIWVQLWIYLKVKFELYDFIIISSYDALTFWMMPTIHGKIFIFNHNNIARFDNKLEKWCAMQIPKNVTHLVFNDYMKRRMLELGFDKVEVIQHGFESKEKETNLLSSKYLNEVFSKVIFIPSSNSSDAKLIQTLINTSKMQEELMKHNAVLILKGKYDQPFTKNVKVIDGWLMKEEYDYLFIRADLILSLYHDNFNYRVSGVLFECIANNKRCLLKDTPNFRTYQCYMKYDAYTPNDIDSTINSIFRLLNQSSNDFNLYTDVEKLQPQWTDLVNYGGKGCD